MTATRPRLLLLTPDFPPAVGGIQLMLGELTARLAPSWEVTVVAPTSPGAAVHDARVPYAVRRSRIPWGGALSAVALAEMAVIARAVPSDVVLAGHLVTLPAAVAAARHNALAVILHGSELWAPKVPHMLGLLADRPSAYVAVSRFTASIAATAGVPRERIAIVENGAATSPRPADWHERLERLGLTNRDGTVVPFFLTVARLVEPHKGQDVVIRALPPLVARYPHVRYVIAGEGPLRRSFQRIARTAGVERSVVFAGHIDDATKSALLAGCRALVMPSREARAAAQFEGFGIVYLEAALSGRPSIGGAAGGAPEVVVDGDTGLLVDPQNCVALVEAMMRLADDPWLADKLGERAQRRAATFTWARAADAVDELLRRLT